MELERNVKYKMNERKRMMKFSKGGKRKIVLKVLENRHHCCLGHVIRHNEFVVNILVGAICGKMSVGRTRLQFKSP